MIRVQHRLGSYPISFVPINQVFDGFRDRDFIITDTNLLDLYSDLMPTSANQIVFEAGERSKNLAVYESICKEMHQKRASRKSRIFAFGGGVVGDLAGFVAATYMRGIEFIQIPTSLLAMVDSSVGGKVGIDTDYGKNLLGSFWPPSEVRISADTLKTLPEREFINGMAEVWKYGFIGNAPFLKNLPLSPDQPSQEIIKACVEQKAEVVEADEFETTGLRATLNFGHTIGHAIEAVAGYGTILHGEAIAIGMVLESRLGESLGITKTGIADLVQSKLSGQGLPTDLPPNLNLDDLIVSMRGDKKARGTNLAFSLLEDVAVCKLYEDIPENAVRQVLETC